MNFCEEISDAKLALANISNRFAKASIFGNQTAELRNDMLLMQAYINTLERNKLRKKALSINNLIEDGQKVEFSALKSQGNNLILDIKNFVQNSCVEYRICLSDSDICKILDLARALAYKYN